MLRTVLGGKIHRATVTQADLHYVGSITIDADLVEAAGFVEGEKVQVVDITNGSRIETYVITGERGSGTIQLNGAAARHGAPGDIVIIIAYGEYEQHEWTPEFAPRVVFVDAKNAIVSPQP